MLDLRQKTRITFVVVEDNSSAMAFANLVVSNLNSMKQKTFSVDQSAIGESPLVNKSDILITVYPYTKNDGEVIQVDVSTKLGKKLILPIPISTRINSEYIQQYAHLYSQVYVIYILSLLINWLDYSETASLRNVLLSELRSFSSEGQREILDVMEDEGAIILCEIFRNIGGLFLDRSYFIRSKQVESLSNHSQERQSEARFTSIEINKANSLINEGLLCPDIDLLKESISLCRKVLLENKLSAIEENTLNDMLSFCFKTIDQFEKN